MVEPFSLNLSMFTELVSVQKFRNFTVFLSEGTEQTHTSKTHHVKTQISLDIHRVWSVFSPHNNYDIKLTCLYRCNILPSLRLDK